MAEACTVCRGAYGADWEGWDCDDHTDSVRSFALALGTLIQGGQPDMPNWAAHLEDALEVMRPGEAAPLIHDLSRHDGTRYFLIKGEVWSEPDPRAEGFNPIERRLPASVVSAILSVEA